MDGRLLSEIPAPGDGLNGRWWIVARERDGVREVMFQGSGNDWLGVGDAEHLDRETLRSFRAVAQLDIGGR